LSGFEKVGFQLGEPGGADFFRRLVSFGINIPAGRDYRRREKKQNAVDEYCFIFSRHKSRPLKLRLSPYLDKVFSISAKYEREFGRNPSFLLKFSVFPRRLRPFSADPSLRINS